MNPKVEITLIQLDDRQNIWFFDYAVLIEAGKGKRQKLIYATYPDYWQIYIKKLPIYNFFYN